MEKSVEPLRGRNRLQTALFWVLKGVVLLLLLLFAALQLPLVQTYGVNQAAQWLSKNTGFQLAVAEANLTWFDDLVLEDVRVYDAQTDSTLIAVKDLRINLSLSDLIFSGKFYADELILTRPQVHIMDEGEATNLSRWVQGLQDTFSTSPQSQTHITIEKLRIREGAFSYQRQADRRWHGDSIEADIRSFHAQGDSLSLYAVRLGSVAEPFGRLQFKGGFSFTPQHMHFSNYELKTPKSLLNHALTLSYAQVSALKHFGDSVQFDAQLSDAIIHTDEAAVWANPLKDWHQTFNLSGEVTGSAKQLNLKNISIGIGANTRLAGEAALYGLTKASETFLDVVMASSVIDPDELKPFISSKYLAQALRIGEVKFKGSYVGFLTDFVAKGEIHSAAGQVNTDINFKIDRDLMASYRGRLQLLHFDLSRPFRSQAAIKHVTLKGEIVGRGLDVEEADFRLNAQVDSLETKDYTYTKLSANGRFKAGFFDGNVRIKDPHLHAGGKVKIDFSEANSEMKAHVTLDSAHLARLGWAKVPLQIASKIDVDITGYESGDFEGHLVVSDNRIKYEQRELHIDTIRLIQTMVGTKQMIRMNARAVSAQMEGSFKDRFLFNALKTFYQELRWQLLNQNDTLAQHYAVKAQAPAQRLDAQLTLTLKNINPWMQFFFPSFCLSKQVKIKSRWVQGKTTTFGLSVDLDSLRFSSYAMGKGRIRLDLSKPYASKDLSATMQGVFKNQSWAKRLRQNASIDLAWTNDTLHVKLAAQQKENSSRIETPLVVHFLKDHVTLHFKPSVIEIFDKKWSWDDENQMTYQNKQWSFERVSLFNTEGGRVSLSGNYGYPPPFTTAFIDFKAWDIENLSGLLGTQLAGKLHGRAVIRKEIDHHLLEGNLAIRDLTATGFAVGNVFGTAAWDTNMTHLSLNGSLLKDGKKTISLTGRYQPQNLDALDLAVRLKAADLGLIEPIIKKAFSQIKGEVSGDFYMGGSLQHPIVRGKGILAKGQAFVNYLHTTYRLGGAFTLAEDTIQIHRLKLQDDENNDAELKGNILHDGFSKLSLDLTMAFHQFKLLNTLAKDNPTFYGTAYASGQGAFTGALDDIKIAANAQTTKGTKLYIPLNSSSSSEQQKEYIRFESLTPHAKQKHAPVRHSIKEATGIQLELDLEMTQEAYIEIIFDLQSGDIIRGRGNGGIKLQLNTDGDFDMFGNFEIAQGGYNFTLYNIINKEFNIQKGSRINWFGDPYAARLDIVANYPQLASLAPLLPGYSDNNNSSSDRLNQKYPSIVDLKLTGGLLSPTLKFGIRVTDYPKSLTLNNGQTLALESIVSAFTAKLASNEQERNRQAFSLILLKKFSPENRFQVTGQTLSNSLSEWVSNQLSYWVNQVDENLEVDVNLSGLDNNAFNTFQLRLSYQFLDGRLKVTRDDKFGGNRNKSNVIGDWTVEYLLTEDGRLRAKVYRRAGKNTISTRLQGAEAQAGISLQYVKSFDRFKQILIENRKRNRTKK